MKHTRKISRSRNLFLWTVRGGMYAATALTGLLTLFIVGYVLIQGIPNLSWEFISTKPSYLSGNIGILPDILNTVYIVIATLLIVIPLGVGAAVYLTEYATNQKLVGIIEYAAEALSGIPSIIYGLVGMLIFSNSLGTSLMSGSLTLVIMNLPTIMRNTQESLKTVPQSYREGAFGLGNGELSEQWCFPVAWMVSLLAASCPLVVFWANLQHCCSPPDLPIPWPVSLRH